ncbi:MAG: phenylacetic acid degradation bifunctional protein PaaZ, partial [Chitinophagaceae bacterium]
MLKIFFIIVLLISYDRKAKIRLAKKSIALVKIESAPLNKLPNFITGAIITGDGEGTPLYNAVTGNLEAYASTAGLDFKAILEYGRSKGGPALRKLTFHERGRMLKALALHLQQHLPLFYEVSYKTGATKADSWIDLEGGIGNLFSYASLRKKFPDQPFAVDGDMIALSKKGSFIGQHLLVPKEGVAVHINAFNFPVWGMLEKIAVNLLAGVPAIVKPATVTSYLTNIVTQKIIESGILPQGALQLVCGSAGDLLDHLQSQDVVTFTGSASTAIQLKSNKNIIDNHVPFNMEADSLNCIILGNDVEPGMPEWDQFIKEVRREMTIKAGQKCTAIRRIFCPERLMDAVCKDVFKTLDQTVIGNPLNETVRMGSLAGVHQREEVRSQVQKLLASSSLIYGSVSDVKVVDADAVKGAFISPLLLLNEKPFENAEPHDIEAFGPVSTLMPYKTVEESIALARLGKGSLVSSIVTNDRKIARDFVLGAGAWHGRMLILNRECAAESTGHGSPLPMLVHGGPGRAGGGEEMGGVRGVYHYMQRVAVQGSPSMLSSVASGYFPGAETRKDDKHPFRKYYEELFAGDTVITHKRTITEADIVNFANLSWDHFYAHTDHTSLQGTIFEKPVAHGYFVLSAAAGLFVDPGKGPVLLNYGLDDCRFLKPVYAGDTIGARLTCKEKLPQDNRQDGGIPKGIVKWFLEVVDE